MTETGAALSWSIAFLAGLLSFLSPCVIPIVPGYLSFVSGVAVTPGSAEPRRIERVVIASVLFVLGFATVFVALGATAGAVGGLLESYRTAMQRLAGAMMIVMGLFVLGVLRSSWLSTERRFHFIDRPYGPFGTVLLGMAFGFGWTPCIGPVLSSILVYASLADTAQEGGGLLLMYALGLGVPFVIVALGFSQAMSALAILRRYSSAISAASGALLLLLGALFLTNQGYYLAYANAATDRLFDLAR